jgi:Mce-associated membrane protein
MLLKSRDPLRTASLVPLVVIASVAVVLALAAGAWWYVANADSAVATSRDRDAVLDVGGRELVEINTLDYRQADTGLARWSAQVTGPLADEINRGREDNVKSIQDAKTVTTARVLDAAVTKVDSAAGQAGMIVALEITVTPENAAPVTKRSRINAGLTQTPGGWKLASVQVVGMSS